MSGAVDIPIAVSSGGVLLTLLGTGVTEIEQSKRTKFHEALAVGVAGGVVTGITTALIMHYAGERRYSTRETITASVVSSVLTFVTSEVMRRSGVTIYVQAAAVGAVAAAVWLYFFIKNSA